MITNASSSVASPTTSVTVSGGNLTIDDTNGGNTNDNLTIRIVGSNYVITDAANSVNQSVAILP